jgi:predicted N-acetyltransferase YhbS
MAARYLPGTALRVRRGSRHDLAAVRAVLGRSGDDARERRFFHRVARDPSVDLYVAEDDGGIVGVVALAYARSLVRGERAATLEVACRPAAAVVEGLVDFATERARRSGCRAIACIGTPDPELRAALLARGFRVEEALVADLARSA